MANKRLILHIGMSKTGSSAGREFFKLNREVLARQGIDYVPGLIMFIWGSTDEPTVNPIDEVLAPWKACMNSGNDILIYDPGVGPCLVKNPDRMDELRAHFPGYEIHIINYLRRQDLHMESLINELIKTNMRDEILSWDKYPERLLPIGYQAAYSYDYYSWLKPLADRVGKENMVLRVFEKGRFVHGSLYRDLVDSLGLEWTDDFVIPEKRINLSFDSRYMRLICDINKIDKTKSPMEHQILAKNLLNINTALGHTGNKGLFDLETRKDMLAHFEESNRKVARYFFDTDAPLFEAASLSELKPDEFTETELKNALFLMNKAWMEGVSTLPFPLYNYLQLSRHRHDKSRGVENAGAKYKARKLIHSLGKRLLPKWFGDPDHIGAELISHFEAISLSRWTTDLPE
jgi:hypothetical protein